MKTRIWYPQLDVYDAVRRIGVLLFEWQEKAPVLERLYIADFYLSNPPLLHRVSMPEDIRTEFRKLALPRPEKMFLSYPAAPLLFHKMEPIQKQAVQAMIGKGVIDAEVVKGGRVKLSPFGADFVSESLRSSITENEQGLLTFLVGLISDLGREDTRELRRRTGLRRMT